MAYLPAISADEALRVELVCHGSDDPPGDELVAHVAVVLCPLVVFCNSLKQMKKKTYYSYLQRYGVLGLRQIKTYRKVPSQVIFFR
jgi:hypothetical protein